MTTGASYIISVAASVTVVILAKPGWLILSGLIQIIFGNNLPNISKEWVAKYTEPTEDGSREQVEEIIALNQLGRYIWGEGKVTGKQERTFRYKGELVRQTFIGNYKRKGARTPSGTGVFQIKISGDDSRMIGWCLWHDRDTDSIESSEYEWFKR
jgi:hypothetical protein